MLRRKGFLRVESLPLLIPGLLPVSDVPVAVEKRGAVFTKPWVVEMILDLAGYTADMDLASQLAIEPAAGDGAFLVPMARRLVESCRRVDRPLEDCAKALVAFELDAASSQVACDAVIRALVEDRVPQEVALSLTRAWVRTGDFLLDSSRPAQADFVIGNPPYIRLEDISTDVANYYRLAYPTMKGRADIYVAFYEAALRSLNADGICAFICADRWMFNQYGAELRKLVTSRFSVETVIEMHHADAFFFDVSAYPAVTVIRRCPQASVVVSSVQSTAESVGGGNVAASLKSVGSDGVAAQLPGVSASRIAGWFEGGEPWPCSSPEQLALLKRLEAEFQPLEDETTGTKVGIGVATGADRVFITKDREVVEPNRLLPLAMGPDTVSGELKWSGHCLVNPWQEDGLVRLDEYPRLRAYFEKHGDGLKKRHTAQKSPNSWYKTIDRVALSLSSRSKLYIPDIKNVLHPVLDKGDTYPHHNLYFIVSDAWDLEVLGGLLMSAVAQFFVESYGVRMRGGYLRFQAQYLRRIRVPKPDSLSPCQSSRLIEAFRSRDTAMATAVALEIYRIKELPNIYDTGT